MYTISFLLSFLLGKRKGKRREGKGSLEGGRKRRKGGRRGREGGREGEGGRNREGRVREGMRNLVFFIPTLPHIGFVIFVGLLLPAVMVALWTFWECCYEEDEDEDEDNR